MVYFNPHTVASKKLPQITKEKIKNAFGNKDLLVFDNRQKFEKCLLEQNWESKNLLFMSSGNFDNLDIKEISQQLMMAGTVN
jgi:UDP-N-acetylmuramate: L-alanyl-gamma-D-glutamyl-meso-diaminopimelate ligase